MHTTTKHIHDHSLVLLNDLQMTEEKLLSFAESLSLKKEEKILEWNFGKVMSMKYVQNHPNYLFSQEPVPFHWDGAFFKEPSFLLFYCVSSEGEGGETLFSNTERLAKTLSKDEIQSLRETTMTYKTEKLAHYGGEVTFPALTTHPVKGTNILRIAEEVKSEKNPVELNIKGNSELIRKLQQRLYEPQFCYAHQWKKGDLLLADNFSLLHGRLALGLNETREFKRIQIM
ncbi:MAG: TauD/TfdA dioxygenase family protein [Bacteriovoracaceae bacterium]